MAEHDDKSTPLTRGAAEARAVLNQAVALVDAEWRRLRDSVEEANIPAPVKSAVGRVDGLVDTARREAGSATASLTREVNDGFEQLRDRVAEVAPTLVESGRRAARRVGLDRSEAAETAEPSASAESDEAPESDQVTGG